MALETTSQAAQRPTEESVFEQIGGALSAAITGLEERYGPTKTFFSVKNWNQWNQFSQRMGFPFTAQAGTAVIYLGISPGAGAQPNDIRGALLRAIKMIGLDAEPIIFGSSETTDPSAIAIPNAIPDQNGWAKNKTYRDQLAEDQTVELRGMHFAVKKFKGFMTGAQKHFIFNVTTQEKVPNSPLFDTELAATRWLTDGPFHSIAMGWETPPRIKAKGEKPIQTTIGDWTYHLYMGDDGRYSFGVRPVGDPFPFHPETDPSIKAQHLMAKKDVSPIKGAPKFDHFEEASRWFTKEHAKELAVLRSLESISKERLDIDIDAAIGPEDSAFASAAAMSKTAQDDRQRPVMESLHDFVVSQLTDLGQPDLQNFVRVQIGSEWNADNPALPHKPPNSYVLTLPNRITMVNLRGIRNSVSLWGSSTDHFVSNVATGAAPRGLGPSIVVMRSHMSYTADEDRHAIPRLMAVGNFMHWVNVIAQQFAELNRLPPIEVDSLPAMRWLETNQARTWQPHMVPGGYGPNDIVVRFPFLRRSADQTAIDGLIANVASAATRWNMNVWTSPGFDGVVLRTGTGFPNDSMPALVSEMLAYQKVTQGPWTWKLLWQPHRHHPYRAVKQYRDENGELRTFEFSPDFGTMYDAAVWAVQRRSLEDPAADFAAVDRMMGTTPPVSPEFEEAAGATTSAGERMRAPGELHEPEEWQALRSAMLNAAAFQPEGEGQGVLKLRFTNGDIYEYYGVPESVYLDLLTAESPGNHYNVAIERRYRSRKVFSEGEPGSAREPEEQTEEAEIQRAIERALKSMPEPSIEEMLGDDDSGGRFASSGWYRAAGAEISDFRTVKIAGEWYSIKGIKQGRGCFLTDEGLIEPSKDQHIGHVIIALQTFGKAKEWLEKGALHAFHVSVHGTYWRNAGTDAVVSYVFADDNPSDKGLLAVRTTGEAEASLWWPVPSNEHLSILHSDDPAAEIGRVVAGRDLIAKIKTATSKPTVNESIDRIADEAMRKGITTEKIEEMIEPQPDVFASSGNGMAKEAQAVGNYIPELAREYEDNNSDYHKPYITIGGDIYFVLPYRLYDNRAIPSDLYGIYTAPPAEDAKFGTDMFGADMTLVFGGFSKSAAEEFLLDGNMHRRKMEGRSIGMDFLDEKFIPGSAEGYGALVRFVEYGDSGVGMLQINIQNDNKGERFVFYYARMPVSSFRGLESMDGIINLLESPIEAFHPLLEGTDMPEPAEVAKKMRPQQQPTEPQPPHEPQVSDEQIEELTSSPEEFAGGRGWFRESQRRPNRPPVVAMVNLTGLSIAFKSARWERVDEYGTDNGRMIVTFQDEENFGRIIYQPFPFETYLGFVSSRNPDEYYAQSIRTRFGQQVTPSEHAGFPSGNAFEIVSSTTNDTLRDFRMAASMPDSSASLFYVGPHVSSEQNIGRFWFVPYSPARAEWTGDKCSGPLGANGILRIKVPDSAVNQIHDMTYAAVPFTVARDLGVSAFSQYGAFENFLNQHIDSHFPLIRCVSVPLRVSPEDEPTAEPFAPEKPERPFGLEMSDEQLQALTEEPDGFASGKRWYKEAQQTEGDDPKVENIPAAAPEQPAPLAPPLPVPQAPPPAPLASDEDVERMMESTPDTFAALKGDIVNYPDLKVGACSTGPFGPGAIGWLTPARPGWTCQPQIAGFTDQQHCTTQRAG